MKTLVEQLKKDKMLFEFHVNGITEAPISNFQTIGDFKSSGSMPEPDRKLLRSETAIKKIYDVFSKTPYNFNLFFINFENEPEGNQMVNKRKLGSKFGGINLENLKNLNANLYDQIIRTKDNAITMIYISNLSNRKIPLTGWTIAHRFVHALEFDSNYETKAKEIRNQIIQKFNNIINQGYKKDDVVSLFSNENSEHLDIISNILTMKSARDKNISASFEFFPETLTQYIVTGKVKFNPLPKEEFIGNETQYQKLNNEMQELSIEMGNLYDNLLKNCVGKVFTF